MNWGLHGPGSESGSRPYQHWDLGKFLDLGQLQFLICQIQVIKEASQGDFENWNEAMFVKVTKPI